MIETQKMQELLELVNNYPSPHNGQPIVLVPSENNTYIIEFDTNRGLTSSKISYLFSFVTIGVFVRHLELCSQALGHNLQLDINLPSQEKMDSGEALSCGTVSIEFDAKKPEDSLRKVILARQTSRRKYVSPLTDEEQDRLQEASKMYGFDLQYVPEKSRHKVIWLNQRAVFDDMFNDPVREELDHWLRYNNKEKTTKKDGLSYDCMELNGNVLKMIVRHYKVLRWTIISQILKQYYLRTMKDKSTVGYVLAPFSTEDNSYNIGRFMIDMWIELTKTGKYLHPFGTIVSNQQAHDDFAKLVGLKDESLEHSYVVLIFRAGASPRPVASERIPVTEHLLQNTEVES